MRILRYEGISPKKREALYGIVISVKGIGVVHLHAMSNFGGHHVVYKHLLRHWKNTYTGPRKLELDKAWQ